MRRAAAILFGLGTLLGCRQVLDLDDFGDQDSSASSGSSGGGGGMSSASCGHFRALYDDFDDATFARSATRPGWTTLVDNAAAHEQLGEAYVQLEPVTSDAYGRVSAMHAADLRGDSVTVKVSSVPMNSESTAKVYIAYDDLNRFEFEARTGGSLLARTFINGQMEDVADVVYDPASHVHWRFEQSGNDLIWLTSADRSTWWPLGAVGIDTLPFSLESMWLNLDAFALLNATPFADARFDDVNSPGSAEPWCPASSFSDDFAEGVNPLGWVAWQIPTFCAATSANGELELEWPAMNVSCHYRSSKAFNLGGSSVSIHVPFVAQDPDAMVYLSVNFDGDNWFDLRHAVGTGPEIRAVKSVDASISNVRSAAYDPDQHAWWRLSEMDGTIHWETSTDGVSWSPFASADREFEVTAVDIAFGVVAYSATGGSARFGRYNLPP